MTVEEGQMPDSGRGSKCQEDAALGTAPSGSWTDRDWVTARHRRPQGHSPPRSVYAVLGLHK